MFNCCIRVKHSLKNQDLFERKLDFGLAAFMITGIALLIIGACIESGYIHIGGAATPYFYSFGGGLYGIGALGLLMRGCGSN